MRILITGAAGFIGQELAAELLRHSGCSELVLTDTAEPGAPKSPSTKPPLVRCVAADLLNAETRLSLFTPAAFDCIYLLHGIMSGAAEANLDLGLKVNLETMMAILDLVRTKYPGSTKVIYSSVGAVYGPAEPGEMVSEKTVPMPQSSYGAQKLMVETLINDFSRRGLLDGRICRLPTVSVRRGQPTGAASSFASSIIWEPAQGRRAVLPVSRDLRMRICSPQTVVRNLVHASSVPKEKFGLSRTVILPGITVSVQEMLDALEEWGGKERLGLIDEEIDPPTNRIAASWPADFDTSRAEALGFEKDFDLAENVRLNAVQYAMPM